MIISRKFGFIFVKTRKTAGSVIEKLLFPHLGVDDICTGSSVDGLPGLNTERISGHLSWAHIATRWPNEWSRYYRFSIERNPWDKVVSAYYWFRHARPGELGVVDDNFSRFVLQSHLLPEDWGKYADSRGPCVDEMFRYESLLSVRDMLSGYFGVYFPDAFVHSTRVKSGLRRDSHYSEMYSPSTKEHVGRVFSQEIDYFGYTF